MSFSQVVPKSYANVKRFWELTRLVKDQIRTGFNHDKAKADARELFHLAEHELSYQGERDAKNV